MREMGWRQAMTAIGADRWARRLWGGRGAILLLHGLRDDRATCWEGNPGLTITAGQFAALVETLRAEGYEPVTLDAALARLADPRPGPRFACLTFDDGYRDNYELLYPLLGRLAVPATIYVTTGFVDGDTPVWWYGIEAILATRPALELELTDRCHSFPAGDSASRDVAFRRACALLRQAAPAARDRAVARLERDYGLDFAAIRRERMMTWEMMREMAASGRVEFGAHSVAHPELSGLPEAEARREMTRSRQRVEEMLGRPVRHFAYPYGDPPAVNGRTAALARDCGYASAVLAYGGPLRAGAPPHALPRIPFGGSDTTDDLRIRLSGVKAALAARPVLG